MTKATALPITMFIFAMSALAADATIEWTGAQDLNLDNPNNWSGSFPADNIAYMSVVPSGDLTLSADSFSLYRFWMRKLVGGAAFDIGKDKSFTMSNRMFVEEGSRVQIKSGTVGVALTGNCLFVGDSTSNNQVDAVGADAKLVAATLQVGTSADGNIVRISDGATAQANTLYAGRKGAAGNVVAVSGVDSSLVIGTAYIGNGEDSTLSISNGLVVSNGGLVAVSSSTTIGSYALTKGNYLEVGAGGVFSTTGSVTVGSQGSSNVVSIVDGGVLSITNSNMTIGSAATAAGNVVTVSNGGELRMSETAGTARIIYVGLSGDDNVLRFDNGGLVRGSDSEKVNIYLGGASGSSGNRLEILNGSSVDVYRLIVGDQSDDSKLILSNASLRVIGFRCQLSPNAGHTGNDFIISGAASRFVASELHMGGDSKLVFNIPTDGFDSVPVELSDNVYRTNSESPEIVINPPRRVHNGGWHTLMRISASRDIASSLANFTITKPENVEVLCDGNEFKVRYPSNNGTLIFVR